MSTLTSAPYNLAFDQLVVVRVRAHNFYDVAADYGPTNTEGARVRSAPAQMGPLSTTANTESEVTIVWSGLSGPLTGNSEVTAYNFYWDDNSGTADILLTFGLITTYTMHGTTGGLTYKFRVSASNIYGEGLLSDPLEFLASDIPEQIDIPSTTISGTDVIVSWNAPFDNYESIEEYDIVF
jgi:hypothetical protein